MKQAILKILAAGEGRTVSGVEISTQIGISRVAVWKHLKGLKEDGYAITASSKGYRLDEGDDPLLPFCFEERKQGIHYFPSIPSTMDRARQMAKQGSSHLDVVIAGEQTEGRGRLHREWVSSSGGLWFTMILKPDLPPALSFKVNFAASLCLAKTVQTLFNINARVKWPNDLLVNGKKLAGLLSEMETKGDMISFVNIGVGLNVNNFPGKETVDAVSLREILGRKVARKEILSVFLDTFESKLSTINTGDIIGQWKKYTATIGTRVRIETLTGIFHGLATDVDETGCLVLQEDDGNRKKVIYGDCFHQ
ncbi:MAG: biotin--[acetyl-CoA-carboxylase] ligase [Desulfobacteraceae bacterium]